MQILNLCQTLNYDGRLPIVITLFVCAAVFWCRLLVFGMRLDQLKTMCGIPWLRTFYLELGPQGQINNFAIQFHVRL